MLTVVLWESERVIVTCGNINNLSNQVVLQAGDPIVPAGRQATIYYSRDSTGRVSARPVKLSGTVGFTHLSVPLAGAGSVRVATRPKTRDLSTCIVVLPSSALTLFRAQPVQVIT